MILREEIEKNENTIIGKGFHHILNDLGFRNELRKLFFEVSKDAVKFRNFIPKKRMAEFGIDLDKLTINIKQLKSSKSKKH